MTRILTREEAFGLYFNEERVAEIERMLACGELFFDPRVHDWPRLRNYEIEALLRNDDPGTDFVIGEWCPFNAWFCRFAEHAGVEDLKNALAEHKAARAAGNPIADFVFDEIRAAIRAKNREAAALNT